MLEVYTECHTVPQGDKEGARGGFVRPAFLAYEGVGHDSYFSIVTFGYRNPLQSKEKLG